MVLGGLGAKVAGSPREVVKEAEVIISMVPDDLSSKDVWLGSEGGLEAVEEGGVIVECSTLSFSWVRELAALARARNIHFLDAPVNGGPELASEGRLCMMAGGESHALEMARPVLASFAQTVTLMGPAGSGAAMKLVSNLLAAVQTVGLGEALILAEHAGLDPELVVGVICASPSASPLVKGYATRMACRDYADVTFTLARFHKDMDYVVRLANELGLTLGAADVTLSTIRAAGELGYDQAEFTAVVEAERPRGGAVSSR
jgi:3-hydroxyisobutyrate dehydrogenase-like beta-hydroxyacid dehydrogenase